MRQRTYTEIDGVCYVELSNFGGIHNLRRGNVVLVKGMEGPQMVTRYEWKRGAKVVPFEGRIFHRPAAQRRGEVIDPGTWVKGERITHAMAR